MSEYLSKKAVLDDLHTEKNHLVYRRDKSDYQPEKTYCSWRIEQIDITIEKILSGAFDADISEVQRLRAALDWVKRRFEEEWTYELGTGEVVEEIIVKFEEALSTTTEPTDAAKVKRVREYYRKLEELRNRTKYRDAAIEYEQRITDICNVLDFLGITIPGINAPKGDGNDA